MNRFLCKLRFSGNIRLLDFLSRCISHNYRLLINFDDFRLHQEDAIYVLLAVESEENNLVQFFESFDDFLTVMEMNIQEELSPNYQDLTKMDSPSLSQVHAILQNIANQNS